MSPSIAILGDFNPNMHTHQALNAAREHAAACFSEPPTLEWVGTDALDLDDLGTRYAGLWVAPGSPYRDEARVDAALRKARTTSLPTFGNCGGFQHMVLEFARSVAGIQAWHAESQTGQGAALIAPLSCSLKGETEALSVLAGSKLASLVGSETLQGRFFCSYGVHPSFVSMLANAGLTWTSFNAEGAPRSFELPDHRFSLGCLFQPALDSEPGRANPVIVGFFREVLS